MPEYVFVCGKNFPLSASEIVSYLRARSIWFEIRDFSDPVLVIETKKLPVSMMKDLGGSIKMAEVLFSTETMDGRAICAEMESKLDFDGLFRNLPDKALLGFSSYHSREEQALLSGFFKSRMRKYGIKAGCLHVPEDRSALTHVEVIRKHLLEKSLELVACRGRRFYLARTMAVHDPFDFQKRDVGRPVQRAIYSIPPRLARIMINLSGAGAGVLLDPFCGIGGILQEAALMGLDIRGVDSDRRCIPDCMTNLEWLEKTYGLRIKNLKDKILLGDARRLSAHFGRESVDSIVTEPWLGPPLRSRPDTRTARLIIGEVSELYEKALREMTRILKPGGRIVIISPFFEVQDRMMEVDVESMARKNGLTVIDPLEGTGIPYSRPFSDYEERHNTLRKISVLEKRRI